MKYWILAVSLLMFGCGGETGDAAAEGAETVGEEVSDALHEAQDAALELGEVLEAAKEDVDDALDAAEGKRED